MTRESISKLIDKGLVLYKYNNHFFVYNNMNCSVFVYFHQKGSVYESVADQCCGTCKRTSCVVELPDNSTQIIAVSSA